MGHKVYVETLQNDFEKGQLDNVVANANNRLELAVGKNVYRRPIFLNHMRSIDTKEDYTIEIDMDTTGLVSLGKMNANCGDIRLFETEKSQIEYDIYKLPITIQASETNDYVIKTSITDPTIIDKMVPDGRDIRLFINEQVNPYQVNNEVPFVIDFISPLKVNLTYRVHLIADQPKIIYLYYGNHTVGDAQDPVGVFDLYIDCGNPNFEYHDGEVGAYSYHENFDGLNLGKYVTTWVDRAQTLEYETNDGNTILHWSTTPNPPYPSVMYFSTPMTRPYGVWELKWKFHYTYPTSNCCIEWYFINSNQDTNGDGYLLSMNAIEFDHYGNPLIAKLRLYKRVAGIQTLIQEVNWTPTNDTYYTVRAERDKETGQLDIYINNVKTLFTTDKSIDVCEYSFVKLIASETTDIWIDYINMDTTALETGVWNTQGNLITYENGIMQLRRVTDVEAWINFNKEAPYVCEIKHKHPTSARERIFLTDIHSLNNTLGFDVLYDGSPSLCFCGGYGGTSSFLGTGQWGITRIENLLDNYIEKFYKIDGTVLGTYSKGAGVPDLQRLVISATESNDSSVDVEWVRFSPISNVNPSVTMGTSTIESSFIDNTGLENISEKPCDNFIIQDPNTILTKITAKLSTITPLRTNVMIMEYGDLSKNLMGVDKRDVYAYYDEFDVLDVLKWNVYTTNPDAATATIEDSALKLNAIGQPYGKIAQIESLKTFDTSGKLIIRLKTTYADWRYVDSFFGLADINGAAVIGMRQSIGMSVSFNDFLSGGGGYSVINKYYPSQYQTYEMYYGEDFSMLKINNYIETIMFKPRPLGRPHIKMYDTGDVWMSITSYIDFVAWMPYIYPDPLITIGDESVVPHYQISGNRVTPLIDLSSKDCLTDSKIEWDDNFDKDENVKVETNVSEDGGQSWYGWRKAINGIHISDLTSDTQMFNLVMKVRITLSTTNVLKTPSFNFLSITLDTETKLVRDSNKEFIGTIQAYETLSDNNYDERAKIRNLDINIIQDAHALWQTIVEEIKTPQGSVKSWGNEEYGTELLEYIGVIMDELTANQIAYICEECATKYVEVTSAQCDVNLKRKDKRIEFTLSVVSIYGEHTGVVVVG